MKKKYNLIIQIKKTNYIENNFDFKEKFSSINEINENLKYNVTYKKNKFFVDITKNDIFSYFDTKNELLFKMKKYIKTEQYEKAIVLKKYMNTIGIY